MNIAEAKVEIIETINRYSHALDGGDQAAFTAVFTADGTLVENKEGKEVVLGQGQAGLKAFFDAEMKGRGESQPRRHVRNTIFIELKEDAALSRSYFVATIVDGPGKLARITGTGIFEDNTVRSSSGWKIKKRVIIHDYFGQ
jgi:hypothetical protein